MLTACRLRDPEGSALGTTLLVAAWLASVGVSFVFVRLIYGAQDA
jgi:hypothetical protein